MSALPLYLQDQSKQYKLNKARTASQKNARLYMPDDPIGWIERHFWIPETNAPIILEPYQKAVVTEALRRDTNGHFVYSLILYSDIKKSAKSTIAGAVSLWLAWHTPFDSVRVVANDLRQADSRTFFYIERAIQNNPALYQFCKDNMRRYHIELPNQTIIEAIPVDPKGEAGGGDLMTCFTELWAFKNEAAKRLWSETTLSPLKFGYSMRWCESYAGFEGESPILEQLYQVGVKEGAVLDVGIDGLELYTNISARMLTLWNTTPRCTWQSEAYYAQEAASLVESEFQRIHRNQWQSATQAFIPDGWWQACKTDDLSIDNRNVIIGADAGVSNDCFALSVVGKRRNPETGQAEYVALRTYIWYPPKGGEIEFAQVKQTIRDLTQEFYVLEVAYDPHQLASMMQELVLEGINCKKFDQGEARLIADKRLYDGIRDRLIRHDGHPGLAQHIQNADRKTDVDETKLRIVKRRDSDKIDAVVALSMSFDRASRLNL